MKLHELVNTPGSKQEAFRVGRGRGSGNGQKAGKGHNGQNSRSGGGTRPGFEGGQNPIYRRLSKRGFNHSNGTVYSVINIESLNAFENGTVVTPTLLKEVKFVRQELDGVKILGEGTLTKKLVVKANAFSASAKAAIEAAGGSVEVI